MAHGILMFGRRWAGCGKANGCGGVDGINSNSR
jgi:hypothetical protein